MKTEEKNRNERRIQNDKLRQTKLTGDDTIARGQTVFIERRGNTSGGCRYNNAGEDSIGLDRIREDAGTVRLMDKAVELGTGCLV